jgi:DivIVA domain-containing protein
MTEWGLPERLRTSVRSPDPAVRRAAVQDLGAVLEAGEVARAELERVAASDVPEVAEVARRVLAGWRFQPTAPPRLSRTRPPDPLAPLDPPAPAAAAPDPAPDVPAGILTADAVRSRRFTSTKWRQGYDYQQVDDFLDEIADALEGRWADAAAGRGAHGSRLTPEAVVNKRFVLTRFREGYDQGEVDDFLDLVVATLRGLSEGVR